MSIYVVFRVELDFDVRSVVTPQKSMFFSIFLFLGVQRADFFFGGVGARGPARLWRGRPAAAPRLRPRPPPKLLKYSEATL